MRLAVLRCRLLVVMWLSATLDACTFTSVRPDEALPPIASADEKLARHVVVAVYGSGADDAAVKNLATDLTRTQLFDDVLIGRDHPNANLAVEAIADWGAGKCGNPEMESAMTLGLMHSGTTYRHFYRFYFLSPGTDHRLLFERQYNGETLSGLAALPLRLSRRWGRRGGVGAPKPFIELLRRDILAKRAEILPLVDENAQ